MFRRYVADVILVVVIASFGVMVGADNLIAEINRRGDASARKGKIAHQLDAITPHWRRWIPKEDRGGL